MKAIIEYIKLYNIGSVLIILRCKVSAHVHTMIKELVVSELKLKAIMIKE
jgi:hypothetical protein